MNPSYDFGRNTWAGATVAGHSGEIGVGGVWWVYLFVIMKQTQALKVQKYSYEY